MSNTTGADASTTRRVMIAWERLRPVYNGVLVAWVICCIVFFAEEPSNFVAFASGYAENDTGARWATMHSLLFWIQCALGAMVSNACFFLGPLTERYALWLGLRTGGLRPLLFSAGLVFTAVAAWWVVMAADHSMPFE